LSKETEANQIFLDLELCLPAS